MASITTKLSQIDIQLKGASSDDDYQKFITKQTTFLDKFRMELQEVKRKKWNRDQRDYEEGYIYSWNTSRPNNFQRKFRKPREDGFESTNKDMETPFLDRGRSMTQNEKDPGEADAADTAHGKPMKQRNKVQPTRSSNRRKET